MATARRSKVVPIKKNSNEYFREEYAQCRSMAHSWEPYEVRTNSAKGWFYVVLRCSRCACYKRFIIDKYGDIIKRQGYVYPDGYLAGHRLNQNEKRGMVLEFLSQIMKAVGES